MEPDQEQPQTTPEPSPETRPLDKKESGIGAIIAVIIIVLVAVLGALYLLDIVRERSEPVLQETSPEQEVMQTETANEPAATSSEADPFEAFTTEIEAALE
jgi:flagellar basal body-associated protein FliL